MIISFDGNICTGKTTLIDRYIKAMGAKKILEYSNYFKPLSSKNKTTNDFLQVQKKFLQIDVQRKKIWKNLILDRSYISLAAHVYALFKIGIADIRKDFYYLVLDFASRKKLIIPDYAIHVRCSYKTAISRLKNDQSAKNPDLLLMDKKYYAAIDYFDSRVCDISIDTTKALSYKNIILHLQSLHGKKNRMKAIKKIYGI